jgi:nucleotide-binding universal stress UspA family protein
MFEIKKILHPTDFSEQANYAFGVACSLAGRYGAEVHVLHVLPPPIAQDEASRSAPDDYAEQLRRAYLLPLRSPEPGVEVSHEIAYGNADEVIVQAARGFDLIVMATHGRGGLMRLLMGSTAERVLRSAPCPVLSLRMPPDEGKQSGSEHKESEAVAHSA